MNNFVRAGVILVLTSMLVAIVYAQAKPESAAVVTNESQNQIENNISKISHNTLVNTSAIADDEKKLVKTTGSVKAVGAGASRGAFSATAYCLPGRTAMGHGVRRGIIAADPRVLRLGSRVNLGGGAYSGQYLVSDTGGRIKGKRIDIWVPSCAEARRFGRRSVTIGVLGQ